MYKPKQFSKSKTIKNVINYNIKSKQEIEEDDNKENTLPKQIKLVPTKKSTAKEITTNLNSNLGIAVNILKRHSFAKETIRVSNLSYIITKNSIYIKKTPSAAHINRSGKEKQGAKDSNYNNNNYTSAEATKQQSKLSNYSLEKKAIEKITYKKVLTLRNSNLKTPNASQLNNREHDYNRNKKNNNSNSNLSLTSSQTKDTL